MPQPSSQAQAGQSQKLGAFDTPQPPRKVVSEAVRQGATIPLSTPTTAVLNTATGQTVISPQEVPVPNATWKKPETVQSAKPSTPKAGWQSAVATFVADGDTANMKFGDGSAVVCRIDGIDAPETAKPQYGKPGQPYGDTAKSTLQRMIENKEVTVKISYPEKGKNYNRALCQIEFEGANVSKAMVSEGMAWVYDRYVKDPSLKQAETEAKTAKRGLWADRYPINPELFRKSLGQ